MSLGKRLGHERTTRNWSQKIVAEKIGITNTVLSNYERDYRDPDTETLTRLADLYEVSVDYLLGRTTNTSSELVNEDKAFFMSKIATEFPDIDLMFKDMESLTAEQMEEVYDYIKYKVSKNK
ncbi:helix-turn-helix transcriptional regulator [Sporosarcina sp. ANT_H38]|uniref:helix-turn-helix domain-containing protein n=1 Tax=Sporosarcina sp. ANT_H38 TaxID=2597358 RepID=UPI0011F14056|nr:helix-turn-helix transcriptional regulator [Sporosarcina sp. ANT_H38]KAA0941581.1 helix-turn-helix transcriptional regulator [Sporosarcina sp. ANT_H38]